MAAYPTARWGARTTWVVQREFSAQILGAFAESGIAAAEFIKQFEPPVAFPLMVSALGATAPVYIDMAKSGPKPDSPV